MALDGTTPILLKPRGQNAQETGAKRKPVTSPLRSLDPKSILILSSLGAKTVLNSENRQSVTFLESPPSHVLLLPVLSHSPGTILPFHI